MKRREFLGKAAALIAAGAVAPSMIVKAHDCGPQMTCQVGVTTEQRDYFMHFTATTLRRYGLHWPQGWQLEHGLEMVYLYRPEELCGLSSGMVYVTWLMMYTAANDPAYMPLEVRRDTADLFEDDARPEELPDDTFCYGDDDGGSDEGDDDDDEPEVDDDDHEPEGDDDDCECEVDDDDEPDEVEPTETPAPPATPKQPGKRPSEQPGKHKGRGRVETPPAVGKHK